MERTNHIFWGIKKILGEVSRKNISVLPRQILNYIWAYFKIPYHVPRPVEIQIEPSLRCNLSCKMCNINKLIKFESFLSPQKFTSLLNRLFPAKSINFTGMGESLLNPDLEKLISKSKEKNIESIFITNAQLFTPARIQSILSTKVVKVVISMESGEPTTFEAVRFGAKFDRLKTNLMLLTKVIREQKSATTVAINVVLLPHNLKNLNHIFKIIDLAHESGVSEISFQNANDMSMYGTKDYYHKKKKLFIKKLSAIKKAADKYGIKVHLPATEIKHGSCYYPWVYPQITAGGELLPCCLIPQFVNYDEMLKKYSFGNVFSEGFDKAWNSPKAIAFRKSLAQNKPNKYCLKCSKYQGVL